MRAVFTSFYFSRDFPDLESGGLLRELEDLWAGREPGVVMEAISNKSLWTLVSGEGLKTEKGNLVTTGCC